MRLLTISVEWTGTVLRAHVTSSDGWRSELGMPAVRGKLFSYVEDLAPLAVAYETGTLMLQVAGEVAEAAAAAEAWALQPKLPGMRVDSLFELPDRS